MKLKEIKPKMAIHCTEKEQIEYLIQNGIAGVSYSRRKPPIWFAVGEKGTIVGWMPEYSEVSETAGEAYYRISGYECVEFSDLIIPELTVEEVWSIASEISNMPKDIQKEIFPDFDYSKDNFWNQYTPYEVKRRIEQWKTDHEKKEPEVEWFWQGRIFEVHEDGSYYQIKDGTGFYDTGEYRESAEEYMADKLKEYCETHEGNYIAMVERVCRAKGAK